MEEQLSLNVDREVEEIYIKLLRKSLEHLEEWCVFSSYHKEYYSPDINENRVFFVTVGGYNYDSKFYVYQRSPSGLNNKIHEIKLSFWDFKTPRLLKSLYKFMPNKEKWTESQKTTKTLKELLGVELDRYAKIMKIKKKM
jgi:hypothetical protein